MSNKAKQRKLQTPPQPKPEAQPADNGAAAELPAQVAMPLEPIELRFLVELLERVTIPAAEGKMIAGRLQMKLQQVIGAISQEDQSQPS